MKLPIELIGLPSRNALLQGSEMWVSCRVIGLVWRLEDLMVPVNLSTGR